MFVSTALKKAFVEEESIMKMAQKDFIMVNVVVIYPSHLQLISQCETWTGLVKHNADLLAGIKKRHQKSSISIFFQINSYCHLVEESIY